MPPDAREAPPLGERAAADGAYEIRVDDPTKPLHELTSWALDHGVVIDGLEVHRPTLEDVYLDLTGAEAGAE